MAHLIETIYITSMSYKLNQVKDSISRIASALKYPAEGVAPRLKRLLDTDRELSQQKRAPFPSAFQAPTSVGTGNDVMYSAYEAFALWLGWSMLNLGYSQTQAVSILRAHRAYLEAEHRKILKKTPPLLCPPENFGPGVNVFESDPKNDLVFFVVGSNVGAPQNNEPSKWKFKIIHGVHEQVAFLSQAGSSYSVFPLDQAAHLLKYWLQHSPPRSRGRT